MTTTDELAEIRSYLLRVLGTPQSDTRFGDAYLPATAARALRCRPHQVWEALWGLVGDGLVYLDPENQDRSNWRWKLSATGRRTVEGGPWEPRDPARYLQRLHRDVPDLDPLALRYVQEALRAFNAHCYLATSVMLGVASEQEFTLLANTFVASLGRASARKLAEAMESPKTGQYARFDAFRKRLDPIRDQLPEELRDVLTLDSVADLLRVARNEAGHPSGTVIDEDTARIHLQIAAVCLRKMTAMRGYFAQRARTPAPAAAPAAVAVTPVGSAPR